MDNVIDFQEYKRRKELLEIIEYVTHGTMAFTSLDGKDIDNELKDEIDE